MRQTNMESIFRWVAYKIPLSLLYFCVVRATVITLREEEDMGSVDSMEIARRLHVGDVRLRVRDETD